MDPDVFVTIAFVCYAVVVTIGIGMCVGLLNADNQREQCMDEDPARPAGSSAGRARALTSPGTITRRRPPVNGRAQRSDPQTFDHRWLSARRCVEVTGHQGDNRCG
jgi:hypothetical protein